VDTTVDFGGAAFEGEVTLEEVGTGSVDVGMLGIDVRMLGLFVDPGVADDAGETSVFFV